MQKASIGCDPEIFAVNRATGVPTPVFGLIGGTKEEPIRWGPDARFALTLRGDWHAYQEDGAALEFNISPCRSWEQFTHNTSMTVKRCRDLLKSRGLRANIKAVAKFTADQLEHPLAKVIGCSTDMTAYKADGGLGGEDRVAFTAEAFGTQRFAGGHIHIGYNKTNVPGWVAARFADIFLGLPSMLADKQGDRRKFYGQAGIFRDKPYGIEYRTLSPYWLRSTASIQVTARLAMALGSALCQNYERLATAWDEIDWKELQRIINTEDTAAAKLMAEKVSGIVPYFADYWVEAVDTYSRGRKSANASFDEYMDDVEEDE